MPRKHKTDLLKELRVAWKIIEEQKIVIMQRNETILKLRRKLK